MLHDLLAQESGLAVFLFVTVVLGGGAGWLTGRALALIWQPWWQVILASLLLGLGVRFIHFALFGAILLSPPAYVVDTITAAIFGVLSYRLTRKRQMVRQYGFLHAP